MRCAISLIRARALKWDCEGIMVILKKGDCEHCHRFYRYSLWHSGFGDNSYAYCDECGTLATFSYANQAVADLPPPSTKCQQIDKEWEPFLRPCECGARFLNGAAPRCPYCREILSATYAAAHMEKQALGAQKDWRWQRNWSGVYCLAIEDPHAPGTLRQMVDPVIKPETEGTRSRWSTLFSFGR